MPRRACTALSSCPSFDAAHTNRPATRTTGSTIRIRTTIAAAVFTNESIPGGEDLHSDPQSPRESDGYERRACCNYRPGGPGWRGVQKLGHAPRFAAFAAESRLCTHAADLHLRDRRPAPGGPPARVRQ